MTTRTSKTSKQLERHFKGVANHCRIEILWLVSKNLGITVDEIAGRLDKNFKTVSEHTRRLVQAGLLYKNYQGRSVAHTLSPYGKTFISFIKLFQHSWECRNVVVWGCVKLYFGNRGVESPQPWKPLDGRGFFYPPAPNLVGFGKISVLLFLFG